MTNRGIHGGTLYKIIGYMGIPYFFSRTHFPHHFLRLGEDAHGENNLVWLEKGEPGTDPGNWSCFVFTHYDQI